MPYIGKRALEKQEGKTNNTDFDFYNKRVKRDGLVKQEIDLEKRLDLEEFLNERERFGDWFAEDDGKLGYTESVTNSNIDINKKKEKRVLSRNEVY